MLNINGKILRVVLSCLLFAAASCFLSAMTAQGQAKKESIQPPKSGDSSPQLGQTPAVPLSSNTTVPVSTAAAGSTDDLNTETIRLMLKRIDELETRIRDLEARPVPSNTLANVSTGTTSPQNTATADASVVSPSNTKPDDANTQASTQAGIHGDHQDMPNGTPRMQIQGFADVDYHATNEKGQTNSFLLGQLDLFITSRLSEKFSVLSELILEAGQDNAFTFEVHRLLLKYSMNDYFNLSAGRYHSSIGYYNTAFHHGSFFQTTVNRPFLFAFESRGGLLPLHNVGLSATGRIPHAPFGLHYVAEIGNGRAARPGARPVQSVVDENNGKSFNLALYSRPSQIPGLQTGFSVYHDNLTPPLVPNVSQTITAGYVVYQDARNESLNEAIIFRHARGGEVFYIPGFYTQWSRRYGNIRPYFRYQYINVPSDDPVYRTVGRRNGPSVGFKYDLSDFVNFKAQYDHTSFRRLSAIDELFLQLSFTF
jgi:hypothetical protein